MTGLALRFEVVAHLFVSEVIQVYEVLRKPLRQPLPFPSTAGQTLSELNIASRFLVFFTPSPILVLSWVDIISFVRCMRGVNELRESRADVGSSHGRDGLRRQTHS